MFWIVLAKNEKGTLKGMSVTFKENVMKKLLLSSLAITKKQITLLRVIPTMTCQDAFYLTYILAFYLTFILTFHLANILAVYLAFSFYLAFYLTYILTFYLTFSLPT